MNIFGLRSIFFALNFLVSAKWLCNAQPNLRRQDLCPDYTEIDPLIDCVEVDSYGTLAEIIEGAPSGSELVFCPFFLRKVSSVEPIRVTSGVTVKCAPTAPNQFCIINGLGNHLIIDSAEDTLWQGFSFRGSNDHAVIVSGDSPNAEEAAHTFCQVSFMDNIRTKETRGGAMMLERNTGMINIVQCFFQENYSSTFGAGIYSRARQLNVIFSTFIKNQSKGYGPSIYTAQGGGLMIKTTEFRRNKGRDGYAVVFNPGETTSIYEDGYGNVMFGECRGVYNVQTDQCVEFVKRTRTPSPTFPKTSPPTLRPTIEPTITQTTGRPTMRRTRSPVVKATPFPTTSIFAPINAPIQVPKATSDAPVVQSKAPTPVTEEPMLQATDEPSVDPTTSPTVAPTAGSTGTPTSTPTSSPTSVPTSAPTTNPTVAPVPVTAKPTAVPTQKPATATPTDRPTMKVTGAPTSKTTEDFGQVVSNLCNFKVIPSEQACIEVKSFLDFKNAIDSSEGKEVIFCGGFNLEKKMFQPVSISRDVDIRCADTCVFSGISPFVEVSGLSKVRFDNLKLGNSQNNSAVRISTQSAVAKTTFCRTEFRANQISEEKINMGGAITVASGSGVVNVVDSSFTGNIAPRGGAIHSDGLKLNIVGSKFVANNAYITGNAIFLGDSNHLFIESSDFLLNTAYSTRAGSRGQRNEKSVAIATQPTKSIRAGSTRTIQLDDGGANSMILSGDCEGYYILHNGFCYNFRNEIP